VLVNPKQFAKQLTAGVKAAIASEPTVTKYDSIVGDGDCGMGLKRGAEALLSLLEKSPPGNDLLLNFEAVVRVVENTMDGTSGAIYAIFLNALSYQLRQLAEPTKTPITPHIWAKALMGALEGLAQYTPAKVGDRTLVDALDPFVRTMADSGDLKQAAEAAKKGSESTKGMRAKLGRTVYVGGEGWKDIPDPGAYGLSEFLMGLASEW
jgi:dihydroxyacetone kinase